MPVTRRGLLPIFGAVAAVTLLGLIMVYVTGMQITRANRTLLQRDQRRDTLEDALSGLRDAETNQRGFLLTGQETYLEPYRAAVARTERNLSAIERWGQTGALPAEQAAAIVRLSRAKLKHMDRNVQLRRQEGPDAAAAAVRSGAGLRLMDELRQQIGQFQAQEAPKTLALQRQRDRIRQLRTILATCMALVTVLFVGWAHGRTRRMLDAQAQAVEAMRESEQHLRLAQQAARIGSFDWNIQTDVNTWSPELEAMYGLRPGEFGGTEAAWEQLVHPEDRDSAIALVQHAFETKEPVEGEWRVRWPDGSVHWVLGRFQVLKDATGQPLRMTGVNLDIAERRHAEEARARLAGIIETSDDAIIAKSLEGMIQSWNAGAQRLFGYRSEEAIGQPITLLLPPDRQDEEEQILRRLQAGERVDHFETVRVAKDGRRIDVSVTISPVKDREGRIIGVSKIARDITGRKRAEAALQESEERFRTMANAIPQLAWIANADGWIYWYNRRCYEYLGATLQEMAGWGWQSVHDPRVLPKVLERWKAAIAGGEPTEMAFPLRGADGEFRQFLTRVVPLKDAQGRVVQWFGTHTDVEELKRAEEALREGEQRFRTMVDAIPQYVWVAGPDGSVEYANRRWLEYAGLSPEQIRGQGWARSVHPEDRQRVLERWNHSLRTGEPYEIEHYFRRASDGAYRWLLVRALPMHDEQGRIIRWFGTCTDIHDQKQLQEQLAAMQRSAEQANAAKDHFLAVLSHELRNPLTPVLPALAAMEKLVPEEGGEFLEIARRNVELEARLIDDLLDVTRIARGKIELDRKVVELGTIVHRAAEVCQPDIEARRLHFGIEVEDGPHPVDADPARLQQVFWNLIKNAVKFTPHGGCVGVRCWCADGQVMAEVSDSGEGIAPDALPRLFDAFEQESRVTTRQFGGLGLGLAISKALVEMHGGTIQVHSAGKGKGATFMVALPMAELRPMKKPPALAGKTEPAVAARNLRILLVEDHGDTARMMGRLLSAEGHQVQTAGDLATAMELADGGEFDVLVSDLGLPDGSGHDLMRELRLRGQRLPGIALSGYGMAEDVQKSREAGFQEHLTKPVNFTALLATVNRVANAVPSIG